MNGRELERYITRLIAGDKTAMEELYNDFNEKLIGSAFLVLHDKDLAISAADEVLLKIYEQPRKYLGIKYPDAWLFVVGRHAAINLLKKIRRDSRPVALEIDREEDFSARRAEWLDFYGILEKRFDKVEQELIVLRVVYDFTYRQIASQVHFPIGKVMWHFRKIRAVLKNIL